MLTQVNGHDKILLDRFTKTAVGLFSTLSLTVCFMGISGYCLYDNIRETDDTSEMPDTSFERRWYLDGLKTSMEAYSEGWFSSSGNQLALDMALDKLTLLYEHNMRVDSIRTGILLLLDEWETTLREERAMISELSPPPELLPGTMESVTRVHSLTLVLIDEVRETVANWDLESVIDRRDRFKRIDRIRTERAPAIAKAATNAQAALDSLDRLLKDFDKASYESRNRAANRAIWAMGCFAALALGVMVLAMIIKRIRIKYYCR